MKLQHQINNKFLESKILDEPERVLLLKRKKIAEDLFQDLDLQRAFVIGDDIEPDKIVPDKITRISSWTMDFRSPSDLFRTVHLNSGKKTNITMMFDDQSDKMIASYIGNIRVCGLHLKINDPEKPIMTGTAKPVSATLGSEENTLMDYTDNHDDLPEP